MSKKHFDIPKNFKGDEFFDKEMGVFASTRTVYTVELLIADEIGTYTLERQWHDTQKVEQREEANHGWSMCYEDGTGRTIPLGDENIIQGD